MIKDEIKNWIKETLQVEEEIALVHPTNLENGDFSWVVSGKEAEEYVEKLNQNKLAEIEKIAFVKPRFINFYLSKDFFADSVKEINEKGEDYGKNNLLEGEKVVIEFTDPNPFKEFHIGHLMPNVIGESIARLIEWSGAEIKRANYQGDVGLHVAKAVWGKIHKPELEWGQAYVHGSQNYDSNKGEINELNKKIYEKTENKVNELYEAGKKVSLEYFETIYKKLDTKFDYYFFESEVGEYGKQVVLEFQKKDVFEESDGAIVFRGEKRDPKLHTRVFVNSQGLPVYEAKELGLAKIKYDKYPYDQSIIVTGNEIDEYFKVLLTAMTEVFPDLAQKTKHLGHGMLKLPTGKMSSRTGDVITAESLIDQVKEKVLEKISDRDFGEEEKKNVAEVVAVGAIKYSILRQAIGGDIIFDFDKSISFEGDSGPYLQYSYTRAMSVLKKSEALNPKSETKRPENFEITEIERYLYRFPEMVEKAGREFAPHILVTYLIGLASMFNSFYAKEKIIDESDPSSAYKLSLTHAVASVMKNGLYLLGIKTLEKM